MNIKRILAARREVLHGTPRAGLIKESPSNEVQTVTSTTPTDKATPVVVGRKPALRTKRS